MQSEQEDSKPGIWMTLGSDPGSSSIPKRKDDELPWVLDEDMMANWSDELLYNLEVSFRDWLFKAIASPGWKKPGRGKWNRCSRMTYKAVRVSFNIRYDDYPLAQRLQTLCKHYSMRIKHLPNGAILGSYKQRHGDHSKTGFSFPVRACDVRKPFCLRLRFELYEAEGVKVKLQHLTPPLKKNARARLSYEEHEARRKLQNAKAMEYQKRKYEKLPMEEYTKRKKEKKEYYAERAKQRKERYRLEAEARKRGEFPAYSGTDEDPVREYRIQPGRSFAQYHPWHDGRGLERAVRDDEDATHDDKEVLD